MYDDLSGDTMKLDAVVSEVFRLFLQGPVTMDQAVDRLAVAFEVPSGADVQGLAASAMSRLQEAGLVVPLADSDAPEIRS